MNNKILILRNFASEVNMDSYNLQEIGLGKALVRNGFNCDVIYYSKKNKPNEVIYKVGENTLTIKWTKAIKFMSNSIYYTLLKKSSLNQYNFIISTEYNQIMTFLLSMICGNKVYLYHGPYIDHHNKFIQSIYDKFLTPVLRQRINKVFVKSHLANNYLKSKGFKNVKTIGVGLDIEKLERKSDKEEVSSLKTYLNFNKKNLLYIGVLEDRRNIEFMLNVFASLVKRDSNINLIMVGNGKEEDKARYSYLSKNLKIENNLTRIEKLDQSELQYLYKNADLFIFPTRYDIFGMVLLESMYFKLPVISTLNGGSQTLINDQNGLILKELSIDLWSRNIHQILMDAELIRLWGENASNNVINNFTWDKIINKIFD